MLHYSRLGFKPKEWIPMVASKYDVSEEAVRRDWSERKTWMRMFLKIENTEELALDILMNYEIILGQGYRLYEMAEDPKTKLQTLWFILKSVEQKMNYLRELGVLRQLQFDIGEKVIESQQKALEEKYPYMKGDRDRHNRTMALLKP
jgi:hypothetical protein